MARTFLTAVCILLLLCPVAATGTIRNVPSASYPTVQAAIDSSANGDTVLVGHGTYTENINFLGKKIVVASLLQTTGDTSHISQTILNGGGSVPDKPVVAFQGAEDGSTLLRGFTVTNGYATGSHGGGISLIGGSRPKIEDCRIVGNTGQIGYRIGMGISCTGSSPTISRCLISNNAAAANGNNDQMGGGIYIAASSSPVFIDCSITNNTPGNGWGRNYGGGVYCSASTPEFRNCTIAGNVADLGGGIMAVNSSSVLTYDCVVDSNSAWANGGGVATYSSSVVQLDSCLVTRNYAGGNGGALYMEGNGKTNARRSTITDNTTGGGAALFANAGSVPIITNCIIWYNWPYEIAPSTLTQVTYCDIRGGYQGTGNLDVDPLFCDWVTRQFTLASNSLCLTGGSGGSRMGCYPSGCIAITPKTRRVPADYAKVQDAILHAYQGDTVLVATGTRIENTVFWGRRILLTSQYTLSGDTSHIGQTVLNGGGSGANQSVVSLIHAEDSMSAVRGFTITNGYASGSHGGGITIANSSHPRIEDCRVVGNSGAVGQTAGLGIYCAGSSPRISRCLISNNSIPNNGNYDKTGGGIYIAGSSSPLFIDCSITNNMPGSGWGRNYGGGVYCTGSSPAFRNCTIAGNRADHGGGIFATNSSSVAAWNCIIDRDSAWANGGAVGSYSSSVVQIDSCFVSRNYAGANGGALYMEGNAKANATRSTITDNRAAAGAGLFAASGTVPTLTDCIVWYNWPYEISPSTLAQITYCDVRGGYQGAGNLDVDPLFCDWVTRLFTLASNSACLTGGHGGSRMGYFPSGCNAITPKTRRVPTDYATIQDAILHAYQGDTVLVATGTRTENPSFWGRRVLLTSQYTLSGDTSHVGQTVLNGGGSGVNRSVVSFVNAEDSLSAVRGFTITNGYASGSHGGGITIANSSRPRIEDCRVVGNSGAVGRTAGLGIYCSGSSPRISRCLISNNSIPTNGNNDQMGGGIYIAASSSPLITDCSITNNMPGNGWGRNYGGGVYCSGSTALFDSCTIANNTADRGGGVYLAASATVKLFYCLVVQNQASAFGGGLYSENSSPTSVNNTFCKSAAGSGGGAFYCSNSTTNLMNTICWRDTANGAQEITVAGGSTTIAYSDIQGGFMGVGNINADPLFENEAWFRLSANSPCVDAGNPDPGYNDRPDPARPGFALFPAMGGLRNDMGAYGGSGLTVFIPLGVGDEPNVAGDLLLTFELRQNYPNPFNPTTIIGYQVPAASTVKLVVYDLLGSEVAVLVDEAKAPGRYEVRYDASSLASGMYLYRIMAGTYVQTRKMLVVR